uniref:Uncharacterized protein n=1 Tax=Tetradesmus obliquus TaxID=3088 RepID=A0A383W8N3_TETOB|eukprot:jgi/Sobl393_1/11677/SZX73532.1
MLLQITYKLYGQQAREDILEEDLENEDNLQKAVEASIRADGEPTGGRVYLLRHKEVHQPHEPDLSIPQLRELLDVGNVEEGMVAGQVLKAGGNIVLLRAAVREDPAGIDNGPARAWLRLLRRMVNGAVVEVEYTDARGIKMPKYIGVITMPAPPAPAAAGAAAVGSGGSVQGQAGMAAGNSSSMGAASGSSSHAAGAQAPGKGSHVLQMSDVWAGRDARDAAEKMLPGQHAEHSV